MRQDGGKWKELTGWAFIEGHWLRRKHFTPQLLQQIALRIAQGELDHTGELMVAIEAVSPAHERKSHLRALEVFGRLRVWDTPHNTGVLLYLALDKHHIEVIADRGVAAGNEVWEQICEQLQTRLQQRDYVAGVLAAIDAIEAILRTSCPSLAPGAAHSNDLPDEPVLL
ncbi:MAG: TPM domain-containing protein [Paralcaligenes sp.]